LEIVLEKCSNAKWLYIDIYCKYSAHWIKAGRYNQIFQTVGEARWHFVSKSLTLKLSPRQRTTDSDIVEALYVKWPESTERPTNE
jgi:hypothetical protein